MINKIINFHNCFRNSGSIYKLNIGCLIGIVLISLLQLCPYRLMWQVGGDDLSYLSHALTIGLDFDLDYSNEPHSGSKEVAPHPMGPGLMSAPFVAIFSIFDRLTGNSVIQNHAQYSGSWSYFGFLFSTTFYYFWGLLLYYRAIVKIKLISPGLAFLLLSSSGAAYYAMNRFTMGHSFEFFLLGAIFWSTVSLWRSAFCDSVSPQCHRTFYKLHVYSACAMLLSLTIRPASINILMLPPILLLGLFMLKNTITWTLFWKHMLSIYTWTLIFAIIFFFFNYSVYGSIYPTYSVMYRGTNLLPALRIDDTNTLSAILSTITRTLRNVVYLPKVMFGSEFGLLYTNPLSIIGLWLLVCQIVKTPIMHYMTRTVLAALVLIYFAIPISIVLLWESTASSFGYRYLFSLFPIGLLGYILWNKGLNRWGWKAKSIELIIVLLCVISILSQIFFSMSQKLEVGGKLNAFGVYREYSANGYQWALAEEIFNPNTWLLMSAKKTPGFVVFNLVQYVGIEPSGISKSLGIYEEYKRISTIKMKDGQHGVLTFSPGIYLLQILVLFILINIMTYFFCRVYVIRKEAPHD